MELFWRSLPYHQCGIPAQCPLSSDNLVIRCALMRD